MGRLLLEVAVLVAVVAVACVVVYRVASRTNPEVEDRVADPSATWKADSRSDDGAVTVVSVVLVDRNGRVVERRRLSEVVSSRSDYDMALDQALEQAASTALILNSRRELGT